MVVLISSITLTILVAWFCYRSMKPVSHADSADDYVDKDIILSLKEEKFIKTVKRKKNDDN